MRTFAISQAVIEDRARKGLVTQATVDFEFTDLIALLVDLLTDPVLSVDPNNFIWDYVPKQDENGNASVGSRRRRGNGKRVYSELNTGTKWRDAIHLSGADRATALYRICPIVIWVQLANK